MTPPRLANSTDMTTPLKGFNDAIDLIDTRLFVCVFVLHNAPWNASLGTVFSNAGHARNADWYPRSVCRKC